MPTHSNVSFYAGQRLSFHSHTCTVRYIGSLPDTKGTWLGVEWDRAELGKHDGMYDDVRYFTCLSSSLTAASFLRPTRPRDLARGFLAAVREKYATDLASYQAADAYADENATFANAVLAGAVRSDAKARAAASELKPDHGGARRQEAHSPGIAGALPIRFGTKVAEEVGFARVAAQQANLRGLRIVVLAGWGVSGLASNDTDGDDVSGGKAAALIEELKQTLPGVVELDLGGNLIEQWSGVVKICAGLGRLRMLKLNDNRFHDLSLPALDSVNAFDGIEELALDNVLLPWTDLVALVSHFRHLTSLSLSSNQLPSLPGPLAAPHLTSINLSHNMFTSLSELSSLATLPNLQTLILQSNAITTLSTPLPLSSVANLDLARNALATFSALDSLPSSFPRLASLRLSHNPFYASAPADEAHMLSLARLPGLTALNYAQIEPSERVNAELYYLSRIAAQLTSTPQGSAEEAAILAQHPRWEPLCQTHDYQLAITRSGEETGYEPGTLGARLVQLNISSANEDPITPPPAAAATLTMRLPKTISTYALYAAVGRAVGRRPVAFRLVWLTGEVDPVGKAAAAGGGAADDDDDAYSVGSASSEDGPVEDRGDGEGPGADGRRSEVDKGRWIRREVALVPGTSSVGFWLEGAVADLRLEVVDRA